MDQATQEKGNRLCENADIMVWNLEGRQLERGEEEPQTEKLERVVDLSHMLVLF